MLSERETNVEGVKDMKHTKKITMLLLPLMLLSSCNNKSNSNSTTGTQTNSTTTNGSTSTTPTPAPVENPIEVLSDVTTVEKDGKITLRFRVNKNIADRTVNISFKDPKNDSRLLSIVGSKSNILSGVVSCVVKGSRPGIATLVISMHDANQSETLELPITVVNKLNTPDRVWDSVAEKGSYTFTSKPLDETKVTASNTTVTRVTDKSIVVTDGSNNPIKVDASKVQSKNLINGGLSYSNTLNIGGFPMDSEGVAHLDGVAATEGGAKSVLNNYFNGELADIYGVTLDKNGKAMYIAKNKKTNEFYNNLQAFTNDAGYVNQNSLSGLGSKAYTPFNNLPYYGNNSVRTSGDIHGTSGYYGLKAVNSTWLKFDKDFSNVYDIESYAPVADDTSTKESEADMVGMQHAYAKILIWNMMSPTTFVPALLNFLGTDEANFKWSEFAELIDVKITVLSNESFSLSLSGNEELSNFYNGDFPELVGTLSAVSSTTLNDLTDVNTFVSRTDLEATAITYSDEFNKMVSYISDAKEYKVSMYDGTSFNIDVYSKDGSYLFYDYSKGFIDMVNGSAEEGEDPVEKVGWFADADNKGWQVVFNDDYSVKQLTKLELNSGGQADYATVETQLASNMYNKRQSTWRQGNPLLDTFSQTMFAPFSGYDKGFVSYSPLAWVSVFSDYWSNVTAEEDAYGSWMTIISPSFDDDGNVNKVSMTRSMSQGDSSSYSVFYPNTVSCCKEGESIEAMDDVMKAWFKDIRSKHTSEITVIK